MRFYRYITALFALAGLFAFSASATLAQTATTVMVSQNTDLGQFLTDGNGMTLYIRTSDPPDVSTCSGGCATTWPPLQPPAGDLTLPDGVGGTLAVITRDDGSQQVIYNDMPLYGYSGDNEPGDTYGQGIGGVWFAATLQSGTNGQTAVPVAQAATSSTSQTSVSSQAASSSPGAATGTVSYLPTQTTTSSPGAATGTVTYPPSVNLAPTVSALQASPSMMPMRLPYPVPALGFPGIMPGAMSYPLSGFGYPSMTMPGAMYPGFGGSTMMPMPGPRPGY